MDDLISRKDTIDFIKKGTQGYHEQGYKTAVLDILDLIEQQDTAFNLENVIAELEQQKRQYFRRGKEIQDEFGENYESKKNFAKACSYDHALEIIKSAMNGKIGG